MGFLSRHKGQSASKAEFIVNIQELGPWPTSGPLEIRWQRGGNMGKTRPVEPTPQPGRSSVATYSFAQAIRVPVTMYQDTSSGAYQPKPLTLSIAPGGGKAKGKPSAGPHVSLDLAAWAGAEARVPTTLPVQGAPSRQAAGGVPSLTFTVERAGHGAAATPTNRSPRIAAQAGTQSTLRDGSASEDLSLMGSTLSGELSMRSVADAPVSDSSPMAPAGGQGSPPPAWRPPALNLAGISPGTGARVTLSSPSIASSASSDVALAAAAAAVPDRPAARARRGIPGMPSPGPPSTGVAAAPGQEQPPASFRAGGPAATLVHAVGTGPEPFATSPKGASAAALGRNRAAAAAATRAPNAVALAPSPSPAPPSIPGFRTGPQASPAASPERSPPSSPHRVVLSPASSLALPASPFASGEGVREARPPLRTPSLVGAISLSGPLATNASSQPLPEQGSGEAGAGPRRFATTASPVRRWAWQNRGAAEASSPRSAMRPEGSLEDPAALPGAAVSSTPEQEEGERDLTEEGEQHSGALAGQASPAGLPTAPAPSTAGRDAKGPVSDGSRAELVCVAALEAGVYRIGGSGTFLPETSTSRWYRPARRLARTLCALHAPLDLAFAEEARGALESALASSWQDAPRLAMWWSNLVQLRWFLWAAHSDRAQDAAEGADAASPVSQLALLELERTAYGALLELAWTGALLPAASSRSSAHRETDRDLRMWAGHSNGKESRTSSLGHASSDSLDLVDALVAPAVQHWCAGLEAAQQLLCGLACPERARRQMALLGRRVMLGLLRRVDAALLESLQATEERSGVRRTDPLRMEAREQQAGLDPALLPFPRCGALTCGTGVALKLTASALAGWAGEAGLGRRGDEHFPGLRAAANLLMMPKEALLDAGTRAELAPGLSSETLLALLSRYTPDDLAEDRLPAGLLESLEEPDTPSTARSAVSGGKPDVLLAPDSAGYEAQAASELLDQGLVEPLSLNMDEESDEDLQTLEHTGRGTGLPAPRRFAALRDIWCRQGS
ncbi:hypothetical protein ACKKBG_A22215 [Auxenochlorella protothecoides x Auxenochlorella symbiontica]